MEFNRKLVSERNKYLRRRIKTFEADLVKETQVHQDLSGQRRRYLEVLKNRESLERFKSLQMELVRFEDSLNRLRLQLSRVEEMAQLREKLKDATQESKRISSELKKRIHPPSPRYKAIRDRFQQIDDEFLHVPAVLFVKQNNQEISISAWRLAKQAGRENSAARLTEPP